MRHINRWRLIALPLCMGVVTGCDRDDAVQRYEVAKTTDAPVAGDTSAAPVPVTDSPVPIRWTIPAGWKQLPGNDMRFASLAVDADHPELQLTVVPLAGDGGSLLSNINRWEGQIGLPPSTEADLKTLVTPITGIDFPGSLFDRTGAEPTDHTPAKRILAAIVPHGDRTWFFKLAGPNDQVQAQKTGFDSFIRSIKFDAPDAPAPVIVDSTLPITFALPVGWQQETPSQASRFRVVAFTVSTGADNAEAVVTHTVKDSGSMLDNINRWRGEVGLDPIDDVSKVPTEKITMPADQATVFQFDNSTANRGMILAMITRGSEWWFFKITGPFAAVAGQKSNFNRFVTSIQFRSDSGDH